jgi:hypothetical protein
MGFFFKKNKQVVEAPKRAVARSIDIGEREARERPDGIKHLAQRYLESGKWDEVRIAPGDSVDFHLESWPDFLAIKASLESGGAVFESLTKSRTKVYITDTSHLHMLTNSLTNALRWGTPITDLETFSRLNPEFAPDMQLRQKFKSWLNEPDERLESSSVHQKLDSLRSGGERVPGLAYFSELYENGYHGKLVFVDKRKSATDLIISDLKVEPGDGFIVACSLYKDPNTDKVISVKYKDLEIGQIPAKNFEHYQYLFERNLFSNLNILGTLDTRGKVRAFIQATYSK